MRSTPAPQPAAGPILGPVIIAVLLAGPAMLAAEEPAAPPAEAPKSVTEAIGLERTARNEWSRLIQTMVQVAKSLEATDPEAARTIATAAGKAQEAFIAENMGKVIQYLEEGLIVPADATQAEVIKKLKEVLEALRSGNLRLEERLAKLAEWKKHLESLEGATRRQKELERRARDIAFGKEAVAALEDLARQVEDLARREREILATTGALPDKPGDAKPSEELAGKQDDLKGNAETVAAAIDKAMDPSAGADKPTPSPSAGQPPPARNNVGRAAGHMGKAAANLRDQNKPGAVGEERKAVAELEGQAKAISDRIAEIKKAMENPQLGDQEQKQGALANDTAALAADMKGEAKSGESPGSESTPGQPSVQKASEHQQQATGQLGKQQPGEANQEQKEALRNLDEARQNLSETIAKEQEALQQQTLAKIETMLRSLLAAQKQISADTVATFGKRKAGDQYERTEKVKLTDLAAGEGKLAEETQKVVRLLEEEATTAVFPTVLKDVRADMTKVQEFLAAFQAGPLTQGIQKEIEERLQEMIEALQMEIARRQEQQNPSGSGQDGEGRKQPLVPPLAELKLLRTLQTQINKRTVLLDETKRSSQAPAETIEVQHKVLADRQGAVSKMARDLAEIIQRSQR